MLPFVCQGGSALLWGELFLFPVPALERTEYLKRNREDDRIRFVGRDVVDGREGTEMERAGG